MGVVLGDVAGWKCWLAGSLVLVGCRPAVAPPRALPVVRVVQPPATAKLLPPPPEEPAPPEAIYDEIKPAAELLVDDLERRELRRAYLVRAAPAHWTLGRAKVHEVDMAPSEEPPPRSEVVVAEHHPNHLRVRVVGGGVEVMLYLAHDAFAETSRVRVPLLRSSGRAFVDAGVSLPPGAKLELSEHRHGLRRATVQTDWFSAEGAVHENVLGPVFRLERPRGKGFDRWSGPYDCLVEGRPTVLASPAGPEVARLEQDSVPCHHISVHGAWHRLRIERGGYRVVGVVPAANVKLETARFGHGGTGGMGGWGASHTTFRYLWPGDRLFADGVRFQVGRVTARRLQVGDYGAAGDGLHKIHLPLPYWGFTNLRIEEATMAAAIDKEKRYQGRVGFRRLRSPTGHNPTELLNAIERQRSSVNRCYDSALRRAGPEAEFRYRVSVTFGPGPKPPSLTPLGTSEPRLDRCLERALRIRRPPGLAVAQFELALEPDPEVGP